MCPKDVKIDMTKMTKQYQEKINDINKVMECIKSDIAWLSKHDPSRKREILQLLLN